ncbi:ligase [Halarcobacter mediterraneus]|uniref:Ligase n=1 Tax=Halarcobacter mediterraneus TaxID=2023153 RepID=A0A4Q1AYH7_9BACT|nr:biotin/lipoate A/B protein ligase family protein [Halarcobacter mediterraneus]RXK14423.1 ligase [Halarcobacter mediterraneus]
MKELQSEFRVINSGRNNAKNNMATDEALLSCYENEEQAILRVYYWNKSFTIGISQDFETYSYLKEYTDFAKRITGGGVLFHGHDISYSLVIPTVFLKDLTIKKSYEFICQFILNFYKKLNLDANYAKDCSDITLSKSDFCQVGFEAYDIIVNGKKIGGNAQRRTKKAIFQHGSIPLESLNNSFDKKIGTTLKEFDINLDYKKACLLLIEAFNETFNVHLIDSKLTKKEENKKNQLLKDKYDYCRK